MPELQRIQEALPSPILTLLLLLKILGVTLTNGLSVSLHV